MHPSSRDLFKVTLSWLESNPQPLLQGVHSTTVLLPQPNLRKRSTQNYHNIAPSLASARHSFFSNKPCNTETGVYS